MKIISTLLCFCILTVSAPFAFGADSAYKIRQLVRDGSRSKEVDAVLTVKNDFFSIVANNGKFKSFAREFAFADVKDADYSYSKKPLVSPSAAISIALTTGFFYILPLMFIKKKKRWLSVQTENDFAVIKLKGNNYERVLAEFIDRGIRVDEIDEDEIRR